MSTIKIIECLRSRGYNKDKRLLGFELVETIDPCYDKEREAHKQYMRVEFCLV